MNTRELVEWLMANVETQVGTLNVRRRNSPVDFLTEAVVRVQDYEDAGIMSSTDGLVIRMESGDEFQVSVVQVRYSGHADLRIVS